MADQSPVTDPEGRHVGLILKTRRQQHWIGLPELIAQSASQTSISVIAAEEYETLPADAMRAWYAAFTAAAGSKASWTQLGYAERNQWYTTSMDHRLHGQVTREGTRSAWWWGMVKAAAPRGAWCYLCNAMIHTYDVSAPMSHVARVAVMSHRFHHVAALVSDDLTIPTGGSK